MNVVSVGGASRSGSTLLAILLGQVEGFVAVGELRFIWSRGYSQNELCGCGKPFRECGFWRAVLEEAYGGVDKAPIEEISALHRSVANVRRLPQMLSPRRTPGFQAQLGDYIVHLERLCRAISDISGDGTIVDSSKLPSYCYLLSRLPHTDVQLLHLVRDSRAVAFSFSRRKRKPEIQDREEYMRRFSSMRSARDWNVLNLGMEMLHGSGARFDLVRYEDLVTDTSAELLRVLEYSGATIDLPMSGDVPIPTNHTVAGNPLRFTQGTIRVRPDDEWRERMKRAQYNVVTALTWPLLIRYGYI
jgi:Sulfotransferase family